MLESDLRNSEEVTIETEFDGDSGRITFRQGINTFVFTVSNLLGDLDPDYARDVGNRLAAAGLGFQLWASALAGEEEE
jgi:hypothetical protein